MFIPDYLSANAYRVLRLSTEASLSDAHRAAAGMTRRATLGAVPLEETDLPLLGELRRAEADVRMALGRLQSPPQRVRDRLFWFCSLPSAELARPPVVAPVASGGADIAQDHDRALYSLIAATRASPDEAGIQSWVDSLRTWQRVVTSDDYWLLAARQEEGGDYEPGALPSEVQAVRDEAVRLAAEGMLMFARDALARDEPACVRAVLLALIQLEDTGSWAARAVSELIAPPEADFRNLCRQSRADFGAKIDRSNGHRAANARVCEGAIKHFRLEVEPALRGLLHFIPLSHPVAHACREQAALCLAGIAADLTWAEDFTGAQAFQEEAVALAHNTVSLLRLERELAEISEIARARRARATEEAVAPAVQELHGVCNDLSRMLDAEMLRKAREVARNEWTCRTALRRFRSEIGPLMSQVERLLPAEHPALQRCREHVAASLAGLGRDFTWAEQFIEAEQLLQEALPLARGTATAAAIQRTIEDLRPMVRRERVFGQLKPLSSAPSLRTVNGVGCTVYGESEPDMESRSYVTTHYFVFLFLPIMPLSRYRVVRESDKGYRFLGRLPLTRAQRWHQLIGVAACVALFIALVANGNSSR
ncbi:MAG: hypothetical protein WDO69_20225 [Pseudomonadota bacterium]